MSYLSRLVEQSGLRPAGGPVGAAVPLPPGYGGVWVADADARLQGSDGGEDVVVETVVPARVPPARPHPRPPAPPDRPPPDRPPPDRPPPDRPPSVPTVARPAPEDGAWPVDAPPHPSRHRPVEGRALTPLPDRDAPPDRAERAATAPPSPPLTPPAIPDAGPGQAVTRHETLLRVIEWLAAGQTSAPAPAPEVTVRPPAEPASAVGTVAEPAGLAARPTAEPAPPGTASSPRAVRPEGHEPPPARTEAPVEVWIDAVNLTLEAPAAAPAVPGAVVVPVPPPLAPPAVAPRHPVPPRATTTDRLRRRYVRV